MIYSSYDKETLIPCGYLWHISFHVSLIKQIANEFKGIDDNDNEEENNGSVQWSQFNAMKMIVNELLVVQCLVFYEYMKLKLLVSDW